MKMRIEVVSVDAGGSEQRRQVLAVERQELAMETLGMSLAESKSLLEGVQDSMIAQQGGEDLERRRPCFHCGRLHIAKDSGTAPVRTLFGSVNVQNPRWHRCACRTEGPKTFCPTHAWLQGRTSVEMLYLESKWASLIPFAKVADLLKEVLPVGGSVNSETVRTHMQATAERIEHALSEERQLNEYEGSEKEWEEQPLPDGPITVGIDGGYVRAAHKQGCFEVIAGKSVVSFRREDATEVPSAKCFGFVQIYDEKPRRRLWELLKSQGMQENQQVIFMSDGGEDVRRVQQYLHPFGEFHTGVARILRSELGASETQLEEQLAAIDQELASIDKRMARSLNTVEAPTALVDRVAEVATKMKSAREENGRYEHEAELRAETKRLKELLQTEKETILVVIEKTINDGMRRIMTERFGPDRKSPYLQLRERSYSFEVEKDTGTGVAYTGLVLFDLTIFLLTRLPILVHDTVIFKNIENDSVSRLLPVYLETAKQSFIALDEIDKYGPETTSLLLKHRVLQLDTKNLLYIKDWRSRT